MDPAKAVRHIQATSMALCVGECKRKHTVDNRSSAWEDPRMVESKQEKIVWTIRFIVNAVSEEEAKQLLETFPGAQRQSDMVIIEANQDTSAGIELRLKQMFPNAEIGMPPHKPASIHVSGG